MFIKRKVYNEMNERIVALEKEREEIRAENNRALVDFHSHVSHEIRVPISIILGYADLLKGNLITDENVRKEYMLKICDRVSYMNDLMNLLLAEARSDTNVYKMITAVVDIAALVKQIASDIEPAAARIGIAVRVTGASEPILIQADSTRLTKAFYNILENSMKHMGGKGEINITVSHSGGNVLVVFKDDGKGVNNEELERVFELSYSCGNTPGSGLGLHLVKLAIDAHGGEVFAKSSPGNGMGIYICLPEKQ
ncbi:MAG: HAMP domain-containing histidine kinase [Oscillospiraceae bacterium]|nr:HAMP domain-containing histidine kinase [Oscillospiraceae bacterium]